MAQGEKNGSPKKIKIKKNPQEEKRAPPVIITWIFWLLRSLGERQGEEKGEKIKKKRSCAELNFIFQTIKRKQQGAGRCKLQQNKNHRGEKNGGKIGVEETGKTDLN